MPKAPQLRGKLGFLSRRQRAPHVKRVTIVTIFHWRIARSLLVRHQIVDVLAGARRKSELPHTLVVAEAVPAASWSHVMNTGSVSKAAHGSAHGGDAQKVTKPHRA